MAYYKSSNIRIDNDKIKYDENGQLTTSFIPIAINDELASTTTTYSSDKIENIINEATELPVASTSRLGGIKVDGTTVRVNENGVLSVYTDGAIVTEFNNLQDGQVLMYSSLLNKWTNGNGGGGSGDGYNEIYAKRSLNLGRKKGEGAIGYHSAVIGYSEICEAPNSLIVGDSNKIYSGYPDATSTYGSALVTGRGNTLELGNYGEFDTIIGGWNCTIRNRYVNNPNLIFNGLNCVIEGWVNGTSIGGSGITVSNLISDDNIENNGTWIGNANSVIEYTLAYGLNHNINTDAGNSVSCSAIFGQSNTVSAIRESLVYGYGNETGLNNNFSTQSTLLGGTYNTVSYAVNSIVSGESNTIHHIYRSLFAGKFSKFTGIQDSIIVGEPATNDNGNLSFIDSLIMGYNTFYSDNEAGQYNNVHVLATGCQFSRGATSNFFVEGASHKIYAQNNIHIEGYDCIAYGMHGHIEGYHTTGDGNTYHAEGFGTICRGSYGAHSEGYLTTASGNSSHSTGRESVASGQASYAGGISTQSLGECSHSEGNNTIARTDNSVVFGKNTVADVSSEQLVTGRNNYQGDFSFIIGNGNLSNWNTENEIIPNIVQSVHKGNFNTPSYNASDSRYYEPMNYIRIYDTNDVITDEGFLYPSYSPQMISSYSLKVMTSNDNLKDMNLTILQDSYLTIKSTDDTSSLPSYYQELIAGKNITPSDSQKVAFITFFEMRNSNGDSLYDFIAHIITQRRYNDNIGQWEDYTVGRIETCVFLEYYRPSNAYYDLYGVRKNSIGVVSDNIFARLIKRSPDINVSVQVYVTDEELEIDEFRYNSININGVNYKYSRLTPYSVYDFSDSYIQVATDNQLTSNNIENYNPTYKGGTIQKGTPIFLITETVTPMSVSQYYWAFPYDYYYFAAVFTQSNAHTVDWDGNAWFSGEVEDGFGNTLSEVSDIVHNYVTEEQINSLFDFDVPLISV